jgi:hypothetical protein
MRELRIESDKQLDRYIARWASKLLLVETAKGKVRARHLTPDELESAVQGSATASMDSAKTAASKLKGAVRKPRSSAWPEEAELVD